MFKLFGTNEWHDAAMRLGERLSPHGPEGYYKFTAKQWLQWAERILGKAEGDAPEMTIDSDAMSRADDIASQFSEGLYGRAFEVASQRGSNRVTIKDVEDAAADCPTKMPSDPPPSLSKKPGEYDFSLTLSGINELTDGQVNALFQAGCDDATPCVIGGKVRLDFSRAAPSYEEAISSAIRDIRRSKIGAEVEQVESWKN